MVKEVIEEGKVSGLEHKSNHQIAIANLKITFLRNSLINYFNILITLPAFLLAPRSARCRQSSVCLTAIHRRAFPSVKRMHPGEWLSDLRYFGGMAATSMLIL